MMCAGFISAAETKAFAEDDIENVYDLPCTPPDFSPVPGKLNKEAQRERLIDPSHLINVNLGPKRFRIPWGYLYPRPFSTHLNCSPDREWVGIQFVMPDLKAPQEDSFNKPKVGADESDGSSAGIAEDIIQVGRILYNGPNSLDREPDAGQRIRNLLRGANPAAIRGDGLIKVDPGARDNVAAWISHKDNEDVILNCVTVFCQGYVDYKDINITAEFKIRFSELGRYSDATGGLRTLLMTWSDER